ncbi:MAG: hypothetical protein Q7U88_13805 [Desulfocapsaceae bacterium]|nr:hypothetical protein [Desulfocapsaceae bacterium]
MPAYEFAAGPAVVIDVHAPYGHEIGEDGQEDSDDASAKGGDEKPLPTLAQQIKEAQIGQVAHTQAHDLPKHENLAQHIEKRKDNGPVERVGPPRA